MQILGIVNITRDSFSDGGRYLDPSAAVAHARALRAAGADILDLGAESTHPDGADVNAEEECARLAPVLTALKAESAVVSVDTSKPAVMRFALAHGADFINDVTALRDPESVAAVRAAPARLILMHSVVPQARARRSPLPGATPPDPADLVAHIRDFFAERIATLTAAGIDRVRLILDPGMGFFLGPRPEHSLAVLRNLRALAALGCPLCVSTSRKSFIGALLGDAAGPRPVDRRAAGTLATELWAATQGADFIRTHEPGPLRDAWTLWQALARPTGSPRYSGNRHSCPDHGATL